MGVSARTAGRVRRLHNTKRGIALYEDKVYMTGQDAVLIALNAETGDVVWESEPVADWQQATT